jgi:hypothetical protein
LSVDTAAIEAVDEAAADDVGDDDGERTTELADEWMIDEVGVVESDVVVEVAPVPQKIQQ